MSQAEHYTPEKILLELEGDLAAYVKKEKGLCSIARDPYHFLELLAESPAGWRTVIHWDGEENRSDIAQAGDFCVQKLSVGVTANLGLTAKPDENLVKASAQRRALLRLVAEVRDRVRGYVWPDGTTNRFPLYKGASPVTVPGTGIPLAAYRLEFELLIALPPVDYRNT